MVILTIIAILMDTDCVYCSVEYVNFSITGLGPITRPMSARLTEMCSLYRKLVHLVELNRGEMQVSTVLLNLSHSCKITII